MTKCRASATIGFVYAGHGKRVRKIVTNAVVITPPLYCANSIRMRALDSDTSSANSSCVMERI